MRVTAGAASGTGAEPSSTRVARSRSSPVAASTPTVSKRGTSGTRPAVGTRPCVVRMPKMPQYEAGTRVEPPVSVASA